MKSKRQKFPDGYKTKLYFEGIKQQAYQLALLGLTNQEIADVWGVSIKTIEYWIKTRTKFAQALKEGRNIANAKVVDALYKRAVGYSHPESKFFKVGKGKKAYIKEIKVMKHYPPDAGAALKILGIRQRKQWADIQKVEHLVNTNLNITYLQNTIRNEKQYTDKELKTLLKLGINKKMILQNQEENN